MPVLTGYKIKRWRYSSTVREAGFAVDTAEIEYEEINLSTGARARETYRT